MPWLFCLNDCVSGDGDFSCDGDEGDLGRFSGLAQGGVFGTESFVAPRGAKGGHIEGRPDAGSAAMDAGGCGAGPALFGMRREACETGDGFAVEAAEFGEIGE